MKYFILTTGAIAAGLFLWSIYAFTAARENFRIASISFLVIALIFFVLIIIRKVIDDRSFRNKTRMNDL